MNNLIKYLVLITCFYLPHLLAADCSLDTKLNISESCKYWQKHDEAKDMQPSAGVRALCASFDANSQECRDCKQYASKNPCALFGCMAFLGDKKNMKDCRIKSLRNAIRQQSEIVKPKARENYLEIASSTKLATDMQYGAGVNKANADKALQKLQEKLPGFSPDSIENAPIKDYYQIIYNGDVLYLSKSSEFMIIGDIFNTNKSVSRSLTANIRNQARLTLIRKVPESDMVIFTPSGRITHTVTVFTDLDCADCRKFHLEMNNYLTQGIKIRYMAFPRAGIGSDSYNKIKTVWCASDRNKVMNDAMLSNSFQADDELCSNNAVDKSLDVVRKLGLRGTPALLLEDGNLLPGYIAADRLRATLDKVKSGTM